MAVGAVLVLLLVVWGRTVNPVRREPITVRLTRATNTLGKAVIIGTVTNISHFYYNYSYASQTWKQGRWKPGGLYHSKMGQARDLVPHTARTIELSMQDPRAEVCVLEVDAARVPIGLEGKVYYSLRRLIGKEPPWPLLRSFVVFSPPFTVGQ